MARHIVGRLNGIHAEPGTLVGPKDITEEWLVVLENDDKECTFGYATPDELAAVGKRLLAGEPPRSVAEWRQLRG